MNDGVLARKITGKKLLPSLLFPALCGSSKHFLLPRPVFPICAMMGCPWMVPQGPAILDNTLTLVLEIHRTNSRALSTYSFFHAFSQQIVFEHLSLCQAGCQASQVTLVVKNLPANAGRRHRRCGFDPWVGKMPWRRA